MVSMRYAVIDHRLLVPVSSRLRSLVNRQAAARTLQLAASYVACMENKETETTSTSSEHAGIVTTSGVKAVDSDHVEATSTKDSSANDGSNANHDDSKAKTSDGASLSNPNPSQSSGTTTVAAKPASYVLPVKRFSAVNINKKFLEKTSSTSTSSSISQNVHASSSAKQNGAIGQSAIWSWCNHPATS